jgi:hypothetical protein
LVTSNVALRGFFQTLSDDVRNGIRYLCSDMWKPYLNVLAQELSGAIHVLDRLEAALGVTDVDRQDGPPAAPGRPIAIAAVGQEERTVPQQEAAEAALARVGRGDLPLLQQPGEKVLRQVEGRVGIMPLAPDEGIDGIPVELAQVLERRSGSRIVAIDGLRNPAPTCCREARPRRGRVHDVIVAGNMRDATCMLVFY